MDEYSTAQVDRQGSIGLLGATAVGNYANTLFPGGTDPTPVLLRVLAAVGVIIPWAINLKIKDSGYTDSLHEWDRMREKRRVPFSPSVR